MTVEPRASQIAHSLADILDLRDVMWIGQLAQAEMLVARKSALKATFRGDCRATIHHNCTTHGICQYSCVRIGVCCGKLYLEHSTLFLALGGLC